VWPYALAKVLESPWVGYGRRAHERTGVAEQVYWATKEFFGHPHNAYLEFAMDNGVILLAIILCLYGLVLYYSVAMFKDRERLLESAVGGAATALLLAFLVGCFGAQTFYPILSTVGMWCAMGLSIRLWQQQASSARLEPAAVAASLPSPVTSSTTNDWAPAALVLPSVASNSGRALSALSATGAQDLRPRGRYVQKS
jgi:O-antigen ligase